MDDRWDIKPHKKRQTIVNRESREYKDAVRAIKYKCRVEKNAWFNKKCKETEMCEKSNKTGMHKKINEIVGKELAHLQVIFINQIKRYYAVYFSRMN